MCPDSSFNLDLNVYPGREKFASLQPVVVNELFDTRLKGLKLC